MNSPKIIVMVFFSICFAAGAQAKADYSCKVKCHITNMQPGMVYLAHFDSVFKRIDLDSVMADDINDFVLTAKFNEPGIFVIHLDSGKRIYLSFAEADTLISVTGDWRRISHESWQPSGYKFSGPGSAASKDLLSMMSGIISYITMISGSQQTQETMEKQTPKEQFKIMHAAYEQQTKQLDDMCTPWLRKYLDTTRCEWNLRVLVEVLRRTKDYQRLDIIKDTIERRFPGRRMTEELKAYIAAAIKPKTD